MKNIKYSRFFSLFAVVAYVLNACTTMPAGQNVNSGGQETQAVETAEVENANFDVNSNNVDNANDVNENDNASNANDNQNDNDNDNVNENSNANDNSAMEVEAEVTGVVEAMTLEVITVNGVDYKIADFTEFKDLIVVGDSVKINAIVNADGSLTIKEIEKVDDESVGDNSNSNNANDNLNSNDDNDNENENDNNSNSNNNNG